MVPQQVTVDVGAIHCSESALLRNQVRPPQLVQSLAMDSAVASPEHCAQAVNAAVNSKSSPSSASMHHRLTSSSAAGVEQDVLIARKVVRVLSASASSLTVA